MSDEGWAAALWGDPIADATAVLGGRWTLALVFALFDGPLSFTGLENSLGSISANILTQRLRRLMIAGLVQQITESGRWRYALTERGRDLALVRAAILEWFAARPTDLGGEGIDKGSCARAESNRPAASSLA